MSVQNVPERAGTESRVKHEVAKLKTQAGGSTKAAQRATLKQWLASRTHPWLKCARDDIAAIAERIGREEQRGKFRVAELTPLNRHEKVERVRNEKKRIFPLQPLSSWLKQPSRSKYAVLNRLLIDHRR